MTAFTGYALAADVVVSLLLAVNIVFAAILHRRLNALRATKDEMASLAEELGRAGALAERATATLKESAGSSGAELDQRTAEARMLSADLSILVDKGERVARSLDSGLASARRREEGANPPKRRGGLATQVQQRVAEPGAPRRPDPASVGPRPAAAPGGRGKEASGRQAWLKSLAAVR
jgi:hypothetical protein